MRAQHILVLAARQRVYLHAGPVIVRFIQLRQGE